MPRITVNTSLADTVCDTNVFRGLDDVSLGNLKTSKNLRLLLSPLNVYEIVGVAQKEKTPREFGKRRAAAEKMLKYMDDWIVDPEVRHCELLGCNASMYDFTPFETALKRMSKARTWNDVQVINNYLNTDYARKHRDKVYGSFASKVTAAQVDYSNHVASSKTAAPYSAATVQSFAVQDNWKFKTRDAEFQRCVNTARIYQSDPNLRSMLTGSPDKAKIGALDDYAELYTEYVVDITSRQKKAAPNDFGDLQFAIYGCSGLILVTREKLWLDLATLTNFKAMPV